MILILIKMLMVNNFCISKVCVVILLNGKRAKEKGKMILRSNLHFVTSTMAETS